MNVNEVPQDGLDYRERDKLRKLMYATGNDGEYTGVASVGWDAENVAMKRAWDDVEETLKEIEAEVRAGRLSPIAFFMQKCLMDEALLASYAGKWKWTVRRHMKPAVFKKLSVKMLETYAAVFGISVEELRQFGTSAR